MEKLELREFDFMGIFILRDVRGIEDLVTEIKDGLYLSRSSEYYSQMTYTEHSKKREDLKNRLSYSFSKRNFVILENMLNSSAKVYFEEFKKKVMHSNLENHLEQVQNCLEEDALNLINFIKRKPFYRAKYELPYGEEFVTDRPIEMDNKALLYLYCNALRFENKRCVMTPGLGAVHIGPFFKVIQGLDYTNVLMSLYSVDNLKENIYDDKKLEELVTNDLYTKSNGQVLIVDDNIGTGNTIRALKDKLSKEGISSAYGAIQFNWHNYYRVGIGEKDIDRFDVEEVDLLTPFDYPGHKLIKQAVNMLKQSGIAYLTFFDEIGYRNVRKNDFQTMIENAEKNARLCDVDLYGVEGLTIKPKNSASKFCTLLKKKANEISIPQSIRENRILHDFDEI